MSRGDDRTRDLVAEHGWAVVTVPEDEEGPGFAYSVGLAERFGHPEVAISGMPTDLMHRLVNDAADLVAGGTTLTDGVRTDALLDGYACIVRAAAAANYGEYFGAAERYYGGRPFEAVQVFWPDRDGRYPWEAGYASDSQARMDETAP